jgi:hypothetical protein
LSVGDKDKEWFVTLIPGHAKLAATALLAMGWTQVTRCFKDANIDSNRARESFLDVVYQFHGKSMY